MYRLGVQVPPGFVISSETCKEASQNKIENKFYDELAQEYRKAIHQLELQTGKEFAPTTEVSKGDLKRFPMLISVRTSASFAAPGISSTVLNLGINDTVALRMYKMSNNDRWVYDVYCNFLRMFGTIVLDVSQTAFDEVSREYLKKQGKNNENDLSAIELQGLVKIFKSLAGFPSDPWTQLIMTVKKFHHSWQKHDNGKGVAIVVQSMVYGNMNDRSGSGVAYTRNPETGVKESLCGYYSTGVEGENLNDKTEMSLNGVKESLPFVFETLVNIGKILERHYKDMQVLSGWLLINIITHIYHHDLFSFCR
jgi:pyruvate, orthophosphate dikinase